MIKKRDGSGSSVRSKQGCIKAGCLGTRSSLPAVKKWQFQLCLSLITQHTSTWIPHKIHHNKTTQNTPQKTTQTPDKSPSEERYLWLLFFLFVLCFRSSSSYALAPRSWKERKGSIYTPSLHLFCRVNVPSFEYDSKASFSRSGDDLPVPNLITKAKTWSETKVLRLTRGACLQTASRCCGASYVHT